MCFHLEKGDNDSRKQNIFYFVMFVVVIESVYWNKDEGWLVFLRLGKG